MADLSAKISVAFAIGCEVLVVQLGRVLMRGESELIKRLVNLLLCLTTTEVVLG